MKALDTFGQDFSLGKVAFPVIALEIDRAMLEIPINGISSGNIINKDRFMVLGEAYDDFIEIASVYTETIQTSKTTRTALTIIDNNEVGSDQYNNVTPASY